MRHWIKSVGVILAVLVLSGAAYAATTKMSGEVIKHEAGKAIFTGAAYAAMTKMSGEVIKYEAGKTISVRDFTGNVLALDITQDTKIEGEVKVGVQVSIEADGKKAQSVKVAATNPGGARDFNGG